MESAFKACLGALLLLCQGALRIGDHVEAYVSFFVITDVVHA